MRPRKRILLIAGSESLHQQYALVLRIWGYAVVSIEPGEDTPVNLDAIVTVLVGMRELQTIAEQHGPVSLVAVVAREIDRQAAARFGARYTAADNVVLREQLRLAVARKRGPKTVQSAMLAEAVERAA